MNALQILLVDGFLGYWGADQKVEETQQADL
jgi:hypothetical protein